MAAGHKKPLPLKDLSLLLPADWAYFAGILDGEGCISANFYLDKGSRNPSIRMRVSVCNSDKRLIDWIADKIGGSSYIRRAKKKPAHKTIYLWEVRTIQMIPVLEGALPYLILKKERAEVILDLTKLIASKCTTFGKTLSDETVQKRALLVGHLCLLNKKGIA